jgi:hypothetical protein
MRPHRPLDVSLSGVRNESSRSSRGFLFCTVFLLRPKSTLTVRRARAFSGWKRMRYDGTAKLQRKLRRVAVQIWMISTGLLVAVAPVEHARGGELMDCEPQHVRGDGRNWAYRILDGRQCWYPGQAGKPKDELRWREAPSATVLDQPEIEARAPAQAPRQASPSRYSSLLLRHRSPSSSCRRMRRALQISCWLSPVAGRTCRRPSRSRSLDPEEDRTSRQLGH